MSGLPGLEGARLRDRGWLEQGPIAAVLAALNGAGEETRVVGGAVRDLALGLAAGEVDLATTARPVEVMRRAKLSGFRAIPTGLAHGTVTLIVQERAFETTTLREDVETDGRHAKVAFGRDFDADARRRDLTINALSLDCDGHVHDPVGGLADLANACVRFIGDADLRIREDYLRILRFFRFSARFGAGALDTAGFDAAIRNRDGLDRLSRERVRAEFFKLVVAPRAGDVVSAMSESGLCQRILAGMALPGRFVRLVAARPDSDAMLRILALSVVVAEDADRLRERLRLSNVEQRRGTQAARALERLHGLEGPTLPSLDALSVTFGREAARDALRLAEADAGAAGSPAFAKADRHLAETPRPAVPFSGRDLIARGIAPGPQIGRTLAAFQAAWLAAGLPRDVARLEALLGEAIAASQRTGG